MRRSRRCGSRRLPGSLVLRRSCRGPSWPPRATELGMGWRANRAARFVWLPFLPLRRAPFALLVCSARSGEREAGEGGVGMVGGGHHPGWLPIPVGDGRLAGCFKWRARAKSQPSTPVMAGWPVGRLLWLCSALCGVGQPAMWPVGRLAGWPVAGSFRGRSSARLRESDSELARPLV